MGMPFQDGDFLTCFRIPKSNRVVICCRSKQRPVRAKGQLVDFSSMPIQPELHIARLRVPQDDRFCSRCELPAIRTKGDAMNMCRVPTQREIVIAVRIPDPDGSVRAGGDESRPVGTKGDAPYRFGVSIERIDQVARSSVPQLDFRRNTGGRELSSVRTEGDAFNDSIVRSHFGDKFPGLRIPQQVTAISDGAQPSAIGTESQAPQFRAGMVDDFDLFPGS